jgi:hypothetical protein
LAGSAPDCASPGLEIVVFPGEERGNSSLTPPRGRACRRGSRCGGAHR